MDGLGSGRRLLCGLPRHPISLHYGFEGFHDSIVSNNLGNHVRSRGYKDAGADELIRLKNGGLWRDRP